MEMVQDGDKGDIIPDLDGGSSGNWHSTSAIAEILEVEEVQGRTPKRIRVGP